MPEINSSSAATSTKQQTIKVGEARHKGRSGNTLAQHRNHKADAEHGQDRGQNAEKS